MRATTTLEHETILLNHGNAEELSIITLVATLGLVPVRDGNQWCYLYGLDLQSGIAGFGNSLSDAAMDFNLNFYKDMSGDKYTEVFIKPSEVISGTHDALAELKI